MSGLSIRGVRRAYGRVEVLKGIDLEIGDGEFVVLVGPSGCGKSTLLRTVAGLEPVNAGSIHVAGRDVTGEEPSKRGVAMVFQNYALYPHMDVAGNMGFGLKMAGTPLVRIREAIGRAAETLGIDAHLSKRPAALSGGQKQRVAIGRAITRSPEVFLFDEPLSNLDAALRTRMRVELGRLHDELDATMVYVTHDQVEAMTMADRIVVLSEGRVEQVGEPLELYRRPINRFVAGFLGSPRMNVIDASVARRDGGSVEVDHPALGTLRFGLDAGPDDDPRSGDGPPPSDGPPPGDGLRPGDPVALGVRPEAFGDGPVTLDVTARVVENLGRETLLYGTADGLVTSESDAVDGDLVAQLPRDARPRAGERVSLRLDPAALCLFDARGTTRAFASRA